jgi:lambda repressor-like predicted transcriptional regulator
MTPREIQFEIRRRGYTQRRLAREWDYDEMTVSRCINKVPGKMTAPLIHLIAQLIERRPQLVFPEYFTPRRAATRRRN